MNKYIYPYWNTPGPAFSPPRKKLPKYLRKHGKLQDRMRNSIKINKETGEYEVR